MNAALRLTLPTAGDPLYRLRYRVYMPHGGTCEVAGAITTTIDGAVAVRGRQIARMLAHGLPPFDCWIVPAEVTP